jgi:hypothetical protein
MIPRFDLYDFMANLIPGLVFLWCVQVLAGLFGWTLPLNFTGGLAETTILIAQGYITGLLLQGLSQCLVERCILKPLWGGFPSERWLLSDDDHLSALYKERLLELIRERFKVGTEPEIPSDCPPEQARRFRVKKNQELFRLIYSRIGETSPRPLTFNAQYGLFRVLLTMSGLLALFALGGFAWSACCHPDRLTSFTLWTAVVLTATLISYFRAKKRAEDFAQSVFDLFMANRSGKSTTENAQ